MKQSMITTRNTILLNWARYTPLGHEPEYFIPVMSCCFLSRQRHLDYPLMGLGWAGSQNPDPGAHTIARKSEPLR